MGPLKPLNSESSISLALPENVKDTEKNKKIALAVSGIIAFGCAVLIGKWLFSNVFAFEKEKTLTEIFSQIYQTKKWGTNEEGIGSSGDGSTLNSTKIYREFLQNFLSKNKIQSVVDVGCGDWEFSRVMNWNGINYTGYDVVPNVIAQNIQKYNASNIQFIQGDATSTDLPPADLLISKDVLQHLSDTDVHSFITQIKKYKFALLTNDVNPLTNSSDNIPIERGSERTIDLTKPPFSLHGLKVLTFDSHLNKKQTLLISP